MSIAERRIEDDEPQDATMRAVLDRQRRSFIRDGQPTLAVRRNRIDRLLAMVLDNTDAIVDAMAADFGTRSRAASLFTDIVGMIGAIEHTRSKLGEWMRPKRIMRGSRFYRFRAEIEPTPMGVIGIIGPWNFPVNLVVLPAVEALAAGNRVMIKMSEITPRTAALVRDLAGQYFDPDELCVFDGGRSIAAQFASLPFDHLFFTGSPTIGEHVARAAAENLVPTTLELGGKNPAIVGADADLDRAANRIAKARMVNGGQVCLCPDYVFVPSGQVDKFVNVVRTTLHGMFTDIIANGEYCSLVNDTNFDRVLGLIDDARAKGAVVEVVAPDGETLPDRVTRKIAPTVVRGVDDGMKIATEEIFGPVLVIMEYARLEEVIDYVNGRPTPLVAYWYGPESTHFRQFVRRTRSGGVARNDFAAHMVSSSAPFGGVGRSGMGAYHGKAGFDSFSHQRPVVGTDLPVSVTGTAAPPFSLPVRLFGEFAVWFASWRTAKRIKVHRRAEARRPQSQHGEDRQFRVDAQIV